MNFFLIKKKFFFKFIFGCVGSSLLHVGFLQWQQVGATLQCGARASHCDGFFCCTQHGLQARGLQQLQHVGSVAVAHGLQTTDSVVVAHGLSWATACGIFLDQRSNLCPLHWQVDSQPLCHQGSPFINFLIEVQLIYNVVLVSGIQQSSSVIYISFSDSSPL